MSLATITSLRRGLQEWAQRPGNVKFLRDDQEAQLRRGLSDPARRAQAQVAGWMLGTWHLGHGMHRLLDGDAAGFDEVRQGQALRRASLLARLAAPDGKRGRRGEKVRLPFSLQHGAWTALLGLALHDPGAERLYDWLGANDPSKEETRSINAAFVELSRRLVPVGYAETGRFEHDPALPRTPIPRLARVNELPTVRDGAPEMLPFLQNELRRAANHVANEFYEARRAVEAITSSLGLASAID